jgi:hypothetical protein
LVVVTAKGSKKGQLDQEKGPLQKRIIKAAADPAEKMQLTLTLQIDLFEAPGPVKSKKAPKLMKEERAAHLEAAPFYEHDTDYFRGWIKKHGLMRTKKETDLQFALRTQGFLRDKFTYQIPDHARMQARIKELGTGELGYFTTEWSGECWALSRIYTCVLRANGIPCRQVSGRRLDGAHHVRAEVFLDDIGWVYAELAGCVTNKRAPLASFFGRGGSDMVVMNAGINFVLPGPKGDGRVGTFSGFALCKEAGPWEFPMGTWSLTSRKK